MKGETQPPIDNDSLEVVRPPSEILVKPWIDTFVESQGFGPRSMYVEMCWLPILGPTSTWLYRRLGSWAEYNPDGLRVDLNDLATDVGLGSGVGRQSPLMRSLERLARFGVARWAGDELQVRRALGPVSHRQLENLSEPTRRLHSEYVRELGRRAVNGEGELIK
jgi:hypothetical protein